MLWSFPTNRVAIFPHSTFAFSEPSMPVSSNDPSPHDQPIWEEQLRGFVPDRVFDAHIHMFEPRHVIAAAPTSASSWGHADFSTTQQRAARLNPGRETYLFVLERPTVDSLTYRLGASAPVCPDTQRWAVPAKVAL